MDIQQNLTSINLTRKNSASRIKYIVIHFTSNNGDTAQSNTNYFKSDSRGASAHYFVDEKSVWQCVNDCDVAWHCGTKGTYYHKYCRNANSLGIEMCSDKDKSGNYIITDATVANTVELVKSLMKKYSVPVDNIVRHYDVTHKACPEPWVRNESLWIVFKKRLVTTTIASNEEELTMGQYEELKNLIEKNQERVYHYTAELPDYAKATIQSLITKGIYAGASDSDLNLPESMMRTLVILGRDGIFGK